MKKKHNNKKGKIIAVAARQANLKKRLRRHLSSIGFQRSKEDGHLIVIGLGDPDCAVAGELIARALSHRYDANMAIAPKSLILLIV